jgi:A/G-specific adenine glycosylase
VSLRELCLELVPADRPGDFVQALMDLGALVCTARPACEKCPWAEDCEGRKAGIASSLPIKAAKKARPVRRGAAYVAVDGAGRVLLERRPEKGLLGGMLQPPLGPWSEDFPSTEEALGAAPFRAKWKKCPGMVRHTFTHFELEVEVYLSCHPRRASRGCAMRGQGDPGGRTNSVPGIEEDFGSRDCLRDYAASTTWVPLTSPAFALLRRASPGMTEMWMAQDDLKTAALPTVMRKIIAHALG